MVQFFWGGISLYNSLIGSKIYYNISLNVVLMASLSTEFYKNLISQMESPLILWILKLLGSKPWG